MLKATGIVRKLDTLGRIVIPMELRQLYDIKEKDPLEIFVDDDKIVFKKYKPACFLCDNAENLLDYQSKKICKDCIRKLAEHVS